MAKKNSNRLLIILAAAVVVLVSFAFIAKRAGWIGKEKPVDVELAKAKRVSIVEKVSASGKVQPEVEVKISPDVSGEIIALYVAEGDSVVKDQVLLKIRPDNYISAVDRARATVNNNKASLAQAGARVTQTEAQLERARIEFDRNKKLFEEKVISDAAFLQAQTDFKVAQQEVNSAKQNLEAARYLIQSAEAGLRDAQENLRKTTILAPVSGTISKLDVELGERVVGTSQMAGTELLRIANLNNMEVRVDVNENDIVRVGVGDTAIIDVDSYSSMEKTFRGIVTEIANTANETVSQDAVTEFQVKVRILNESYKDLTSKNKKLSPFRPGMTASVDIVTARKSNVLSVPLAAVTTRNPDAPKGADRENKGGQGENNQNNQGGAQPAPGAPVKPEELKEVVFVNNAGKAEMRLVRTGISDYDNIEIITGLKEGEEIVAGPYMVVSKRLNDGDAVAQRKADERVAKGAGNP